MDTPEIIKEIEKIVGNEIKLHPASIYPDIITGLMTVKNGQPKYAMKGEDLIGLNLAGVGLTDQQWKDILKLLDTSVLQGLNLSRNQLESLEIEAGFINLIQLEICENKQLDEINMSSGLPKLERLILRDNGCVELVFPSGFLALNYLDASRNQLKKIEFKGEMPKLRCLNFSGNKLKNIDVLMMDLFKGLEYFYLSDNPLNASLEVYRRKDDGANYNFAFRKLKEEFKLGARILNKEYKVIIVGDGTAGKTCFVNRLLYNEFIEADSTHGITIQQYEDKERIFGFDHIINLWDFGGQDIYHTTHRLFLQSNAVYLLLWNMNTEENDSSTAKIENKKKDFENQKVSYWMEYISVFGKGSPVLLIKTHKEEKKHKNYRLKNKAGLEEQYYKKVDSIWFAEVDSKIAYNKREGGFKNMMHQLSEAIYNLGREEYLPEHWIAVKNHLEKKIRDKQDLDKTMTYRDYKTMAINYGVKDPKILLTNWLKPLGTVFYREGYFNNEIILDQEWAIRAIYVLFDRHPKSGCYYEILKNNGGFTWEELETYWDDYTEEERIIFLEFMLACGMCYEIRKTEERSKDIPLKDRAYIAPQILPEDKPSDFSILRKKWKDQQQKILRIRFQYEFSYYHYFQQFLVETQADAKEMKSYYRYGMRIYDSNSDALIIFDKKNKQINISISENGKILLDRIQNRFKDIHKSDVKTFVSVGDTPMIDLNKLNKHKEQALRAEERIEAENGKLVEARRYAPFFELDEKEVFEKAKEKELTSIMDSTAEPCQAKIYFSYAWGDDKEKGESREKIVNDLFKSLDDAGFRVFRDKEELGFMQSITKYMNKLSKGDQIFIFISEKYFKSINCMYELNKIALECKLKKEEFQERVVLIPVEWISFHKSKVINDYLKFWNEEKKELAQDLEERKELGSRPSSAEQEKERLIHDLISNRLPDVTSWIADINQSSKEMLKSKNFEKIKLLLNGRLSKQLPVKNKASSLAHFVEEFITDLQQIEKNIIGRLDNVEGNIIDRITQTEVKILKEISDLPEQLKDDLKQVFKSLNNNFINEHKASQLNQELLAQIKINLESLPKDLQNHWNHIQEESKDIVDIKGKFKWHIAIIPGLLKYEKEITFKIPVLEWAKKWWGDNFKLNSETK